MTAAVRPRVARSCPSRVPALVVLAAEPLYLLVDTAVVGPPRRRRARRPRRRRRPARLGRRAAELPRLRHDRPRRPPRRCRRPGRRRRRGRAGHLAGPRPRPRPSLLLFQLLAGPLTRAARRRRRAGRGRRGSSGCGSPASAPPLLLVSLAGNGWLRGVAGPAPSGALRARRQPASASCSARCWCTRSGWGWPGSALANVRRAGGHRGAVPPGAGPGGRRLAAAAAPPSRAQLVIGRDLLLRAAVLQLSFLVAAGVAARVGHRGSWAPTRSPCSCSSSSRWSSTPTRSPRRPWSGTPSAASRPAEARATARRVALWGLGTGLRRRRCPAGAARRPAAAVHRRPRRPRAGRARLVVPRRHAAAGRGGLRPRRRADGRRRRRLPAHGHHRLGGRSASCRCRCSPSRSAGGWPASGPGCACSSGCGWSASSRGWRVIAG